MFHFKKNILLATGLFYVTSCGEENGLKNAFVPQTIVPATQNASPIHPGTELVYNIGATFRRSTDNASGVTEGEAQSSGTLCLKVASLHDVALPDYQDQPQTTIQTRVQVRSTDGTRENFDISDQNDILASYESVDALLSPLWLKKIAVPSHLHGYEVPKIVDFTTQSAPTPDKNLMSVPFFETRLLQKQNWTGWEYNDTMPNAGNFLNLLLGYFLNQPQFGTAFYTNSSLFQSRTITPPNNCATYTDSRSCAANQCRWTMLPGANQSTCASLYSARFIWRENQQAPLSGPVLHQIEFLYDMRGILASASEMIVPDLGGSLPSEITGCGSTCLSASWIGLGDFSYASAEKCRE